MVPALRERTIDGKDRIPAPEKVSSALREGTGGKTEFTQRGLQEDVPGEMSLDLKWKLS